MKECCVCYNSESVIKRGGDNLIIEFVCEHFICESCFNNLAKWCVDPLRCPVCRVQITWDESFRENEVALDFEGGLETEEEEEEFDINRIPCATNKSEEANHFCPHCKEFYCDGCLEAHEHQEICVTIEESTQRGYVSPLTGVMEYKLCKWHPGEPITQFCTWCKNSVCKTCSENMMGHCGHGTIPIQEAIDEKKQAVNKTMELIEINEQRLRLCLRNSGAIRTKIDVESKRGQMAVNKFFGDLATALVKVRDDVLQEMDDHRIADIKSLRFQEDDIEHMVTEATKMKIKAANATSPHKNEELKHLMDALECAKICLGEMRNHSIHPEFYLPLSTEMERETGVSRITETAKSLVRIPPKNVDTHKSYIYASLKTAMSDEEVDVSVYLFDTQGGWMEVKYPLPVKISIRDSNGNEVLFNTSNNWRHPQYPEYGKPWEKNRFRISFSVKKAGSVELRVLYRGAHIAFSPHKIEFVDPEPLWRRYTHTEKHFRFDCRVHGKPGYAVSLAPITDNSIAVVDSNTNTIRIFTINGVYLISFGGRGDSPGCFNNPVFVTHHKDTLYVSDEGNKRVQIFSGAGKWLRSLEGRFESPRGISIYEKTGYIFITDHLLKNVQIFTPEGHFFNSFSGTMNHPLEAPTHAAMVGSFTLVVAEPSLGRIRAFNMADMELAWEHTNLKIGQYFTIDEHGTILVPSIDSILIYNKYGDFSNVANENLRVPSDVKIGLDGRVLICEPASIVVSWK